MDKKFKLSILTPRKPFFIGNVELLDIQVFNGYIGILKDHIPFISSIKTNYFWIIEKGDKKEGIIFDGILSVTKEEVTIVTSHVHWLIDRDKKIISNKLKQNEDSLKNANLSDYEKVMINRKIIYYQKQLDYKS